MKMVRDQYVNLDHSVIYEKKQPWVTVLNRVFRTRINSIIIYIFADQTSFIYGRAGSRLVRIIYFICTHVYLLRFVVVGDWRGRLKLIFKCY